MKNQSDLPANCLELLFLFFRNTCLLKIRGENKKCKVKSLMESMGLRKRRHPGGEEHHEERAKKKGGGSLKVSGTDYPRKAINLQGPNRFMHAQTLIRPHANKYMGSSPLLTLSVILFF